MPTRLEDARHDTHGARGRHPSASSCVSPRLSADGNRPSPARAGRLGCCGTTALAFRTLKRRCIDSATDGRQSRARRNAGGRKTARHAPTSTCDCPTASPDVHETVRSALGPASGLRASGRSRVPGAVVSAQDATCVGCTVMTAPSGINVPSAEHRRDRPSTMGGSTFVAEHWEHSSTYRGIPASSFISGLGLKCARD